MTDPKLTVSRVRELWLDPDAPPPLNQATQHVAFLLDEIDRLRAGQSVAANELVMMAAELGWATDGTLTVAVRHAQGVLARRTEQRDNLRHEVDMLSCQLGIARSRSTAYDF